MNSDEYVAIVDKIFDTEETQKPFGKHCASQLITLKPEHLMALQQGRLLAIDDQGEYVVYLKFAGGDHV